MRIAWIVALAVGCSSDWRSPDALSAGAPEAPSALAACAAGGGEVDGEVSAVLCTAPTDLLTAPVRAETVALEPGPVHVLAP